MSFDHGSYGVVATFKTRDHDIMGGGQNYGALFGSYYHTAPSILGPIIIRRLVLGGPKRGP